MEMLTKNDIDRWEDDGGAVRKTLATIAIALFGMLLGLRDFWREHRKANWVGTIAGLVIVVLACLIVAGGCAANAEQPVRQNSAQSTETPTSNAQNTDTQGFNARFQWTNATPGVATFDGGPMFASSQPADGVDDGAMVDDFNAGIASAGHKRSRMGYQQTNIFTITTGGTAPTVTGSATGTGTGSNAADQKPAQTQTQDIKPRTAVDTNLANTPGGVANQSGAPNAGEGNASSTQDNQVDQRIARLEAAAQQQASLLGQIFQALNAAKIPPVAPVTTTMPVEMHE